VVDADGRLGEGGQIVRLYVRLLVGSTHV
jgi:hypothetical protein